MPEINNFPGFLRLSARPPADQPGFDPHLETGLLRHRPASVVPLTWFPDQEGRFTFYADVRDLEPLSETLKAVKHDKFSGYRLLGRVLEAVDDALDHLFDVDPCFLCPDLIFTDQKTEGSDAAIRLICLPFPLDSSAARGSREPLIDQMARAFPWEKSLADRFKNLFDNRAYADLLAEIRTLTGPAERGPTTITPPQKTVLKPVSAAWSFSSFLDKLGRLFFRSVDQDDIHETTRELELASGAYKIAQLSEGLPGTPEEEHGRRAYILTEEYFIGRDQREADLCIDSSSISRLHARITLKGGSFQIEDLGSRNGTSLDGLRLNRHRAYLLPDKCRIAFGDHYYYFRCE